MGIPGNDFLKNLSLGSTFIRINTYIFKYVDKLPSLLNPSSWTDAI